jgi:hypothetical protein
MVMDKTGMTLEQFAESLMTAMKADAAMSFPRNREFESGRAWVLRRAELLMRELLDASTPSPDFTLKDN